MMPIELAGLDPAPENADQYPSYLNTTVDRIRQSGNPFNPSIESLDAMVQSLLVGLPATSDTVPSPPEPTVAGELDGLWITNIGRLDLKQDVNGSGEITATTDSYGDLGRQDVLQGTVNGDTATLNSQMLGDLTLVFSGNTFTTVKDSPVSFCGIRASESNELPDGCGFSGTWILAADSFFPQGTTVVLKQVNGMYQVIFMMEKGAIVFDTLAGSGYLGKGVGICWHERKGHTITLMMNPSETRVCEVAEINPPRLMDAAGEGSLYDGFIVGILSG
ncbi:MAG: hypothetical protein IPO36_24115 [Anaerolineales bacterium]|nr:hypothetical protein [Anaerolineales bacterium]